MKLVVFILILLFIGYNSVYVVNEGQQVILTQFGEPVGTKVVDAGLYFKIPMIQKVNYFDKRILKWDGEPNEIPTNDKMFIWVDTTARWKIVDPLLFWQRLKTMNRATLTMDDLINGAVRDFVTKNNLAEIIRSSDWNEAYVSSTESATRKEKILIGRDQFSQLVLDNVSKITNGFGIEILDVLVKRVNYTNQVREKVYSRMISERERIAAQKRSEGEAKKAEILGEMARRLKEIQSQAYLEAETIRGTADAKATAIYGKAYNKDPEFYAFITTLDGYKKIIGNNTKLIIQSDAPLYKYLKDFNKGF